MTSVQNILIITSWGGELGLGHLSRSVALKACFIEHGIDVYMGTDATSTNCANPLSSCQIDLTFETFEQCEKPTRKFILENHIRCVVIDVIQKQYEKLQWLQKQLGLTTVAICLFDFGPKNRFERITIEPNTSRNTVRKAMINGSIRTIFSGRAYNVVNELLAKKHMVCGEVSRKYDILVSMGGTDPFNLTLKAVAALKNSNRRTKVLLAKTHRTYSAVKSIAEDNKNISVEEPSSRFIELLANSKIIIINGGITRVEACLTSTPFVALSIHKKQYDITNQLTQEGVGVNLGIHHCVTDSDIISTTERLLENPQSYRKNPGDIGIDLYASRRILQIIQSHDEAFK